ncbi:hypothetical protein FBU59_005018, partial [Linderina macrospora]
MASGFLRWKSHADKLLRFNHLTMTLSAEPFNLSNSGAQAMSQQQHQRRSERMNQRFALESRHATVTIQYAFDSTSNFPQPFLASTPRFHSSFEPSLRHLPCILLLHGNEPGGFDVARWMAGGMSHAHQLMNPLMPSRFGTYSVYNVQEFGGTFNQFEGGQDEEPKYTRVKTERVGEAGTKKPRARYAEPATPFSLLSLSRPGYLETSSSHTPTFTSQATAIARLVENLRVPSVHIVAHQVAGPVALEIAALSGFRQRVRSISLIDPQLSPPGKTRRLSDRLGLLGPEWTRTRAAYSALARSSDDPYFRKIVSEICGSESIAEIEDDMAMAQLYEGISVFFSHWNMRKPGVLTDLLMWDQFDRRSWGAVKAPVQCISSTTDPDGSFQDADLAREEASKAALASIRNPPEFVRLAGSGKMLFPLGKVSGLCLDFI